MTLKQNKNLKPTLVLKFGGTSIGKFPLEICGQIIPELLENYRVVVVCSARSTEDKAKGTTTLLMKAADVVIDSTVDISNSDIISEILNNHIEAGNKYIKSEVLRKEYEESVTAMCKKLEKLLHAAQVIDEVSPRTKDIIIGTGEQLACVFVSCLLRDNRISAQVVDLGKAIKKEFDSNSLDQSFFDYLSSRFGDLVMECGNNVPVVTGFFGPVPGSILYSIGRGYTDLTSALIAVGIGAQELQIWKEVDGVFTADPRKVPQARLLNIITPEEASELTYYGSEVVHPFTMEQVISHNIPIRIKNVKNPAGPGTVISPDLMSRPVSRSSSFIGSRSDSPQTQSTPELLLKNGYMLDMSRRHPTAVTIKDDIVILNIHSNRKSVSHGFFEKIFSTLNKYGIIVDLISTSEVHVSMALPSHVIGRFHGDVVRDLSKLGKVDIFKNMAILSLVGKQMRNMVGISSRLFTTLANVGVNIEMISQGASEINISCVISAEHAKRALIAVHECLLPKENSLEDDPEAAKDLLKFREELATSLNLSESQTPTLNSPPIFY
ncbi:hypothetical protein BB559_004479 [Furculomyces boomerangus]|uniref:Aspartokinase n=2 Tax=Harpellales TaxID=61421 RepID=A0A2T9Y8I9_9FUNG|nr:hypothetical protein BB559_005470 [Furculomyces boomerangus]PVU90727.1 hypothetical protein BB559_004479 [Furculomyces boomerangus]PWA00076.1 hypothetical protein BB558_003929 [Smittium angustum]PWA02486.1 hypothetical protein BB558_001329 [Smittium angustum]